MAHVPPVDYNIAFTSTNRTPHSNAAFEMPIIASETGGQLFTRVCFQLAPAHLPPHVTLDNTTVVINVQYVTGPAYLINYASVKADHLPVQNHGTLTGFLSVTFDHFGSTSLIVRVSVKV